MQLKRLQWRQQLAIPAGRGRPNSRVTSRQLNLSIVCLLDPALTNGRSYEAQLRSLRSSESQET